MSKNKGYDQFSIQSFIFAVRYLQNFAKSNKYHLCAIIGQKNVEIHQCASK